DFWALKWGDLLRIKSEYPVRVWPKAVAVYYQWVHDSLAANKPYDQFARELVTATGSNFRVGPLPRASTGKLDAGRRSGPRRVFRAGELQSHPGMEGRDRLYGLPRDLEAPAHPRRGGAAASRSRLARESGRRGRSARATGGMADGAGQSLLRQSN